MALNIYQNPVLALGGITQDPYHLNLFQFPVLVLGTTYSPPVALSYVATGGLTLSGTSLNQFKLKHIATGGLTLRGTSEASKINATLDVSYTSTGGLTLDGDSTEAFVGIYSTTVNYLITGPNQREITNNNKYFKLEITNNASFDDLNITLTSSDLNGTFSEISPITNETRYVEFFYFPSEVGKHQIDAICTNENIDFIGSKFEFLSTSSDPEEGLNPKIRFKVDFRLENLSLDINAINGKTIEIPNVSNVLRHGDEFVLHGEAALYVKKNYVNGVFNCLRII